METLQADCCIAGGGPAGMMLGLLLARQGVRVVVLEKHGDFLRDFRGDTIHPSTMEALHDIGLLEGPDGLLSRPHDKAPRLFARVAGRHVQMADFSHLPVRAPYIAFMPQWDFLDFLSGKAQAYPSFALRMQAEVTGLLREGGRIVGATARTPGGELHVRAALVVGADGRGSRVREEAGLRVLEDGAPIDVLWFRMPRREGDPDESLGRIDPGSFMILINRGGYWQCGYVIPKGDFAPMKAAGLEAFRARVGRSAPFLAERTADALGDWEQVHLLTVRVDRLKRWHRDGLLCIGDAAHAMSPVGGVGINLAIQDAIATARILAGPLKAGTVSDADLARVERRRSWPARMTQRLQILVHRKVIYGVLKSGKPFGLPLLVRLVDRFPVLSRIPARLIGMGFRPERIRN